MKSFSRVLLSCIFLSCCTTFGAISTPLFSDGKSSWEIRIPLHPTAPEQYAAEELQATLRKISGAELAIVPTDVIQPGPAIVLGTAQSSREIASLSRELPL